MPHLDPERLAALDHDGPSAEELAHLTGCAVCAGEREAFARLATFAHAHGETVVDRGARLTEWGALSAHLRADGLLTRPADTAEIAIEESARVVDERLLRVTTPLGPTPRIPAQNTIRVPRGISRAVSRRWSGAMRFAAGVALMAGGVAVGRVSAGSDILPSRTPFGTPTASSEDAFASVAEASGVLEQAQRDYQRASLWLSSHDTTVNAQAVYRARLAALEQMMTASRAGLYEAPQDPVLNQYYLAAYTAREATLRQLGASLPVDRVMESF